MIHNNLWTKLLIKPGKHTLYYAVTSVASLIIAQRCNNKIGAKILSLLLQSV